MKFELEEVEKSCMRLVVRALRDYREKALEIFKQENDEVGDIAEDITREALDGLGVPRIAIRLYGKVDYKRAAVVFLPDREIDVALMIDSKAEKDGNTATIQMSQTSMQIRQKRAGKSVVVDGALPTFIEREGTNMQTVTIIVKYFYEDLKIGFALKEIKIACIPNGLLQDDYNLNENDTIWKAGRNAPTLGEEFRVRLSFAELAKRAEWRVVTV
jgi:Type II restriction enzyme SfiI